MISRPLLLSSSSSSSLVSHPAFFPFTFQASGSAAARLMPRPATAKPVWKQCTVGSSPPPPVLHLLIDQDSLPLSSHPAVAIYHPSIRILTVSTFWSCAMVRPPFFHGFGPKFCDKKRDKKESKTNGCSSSLLCYHAPKPQPLNPIPPQLCVLIIALIRISLPTSPLPISHTLRFESLFFFQGAKSQGYALLPLNPPEEPPAFV